MTQSIQPVHEQQKPIPAPNPSQDALKSLWSHAKMLSESDLVPQVYRSKPANCLVAIELASRLGASPLQVMQSLDIIQGKPSWSSKFLIASVNSTKRFSPIRYRYEGKQGTPDWGCRAVATDVETKEELVGPLVNMKMAKDEGWLDKSGSKWKTMPELMLAYRAAAFWTRLNCPEVSMGLHTSEEREDLIVGQVNRGNMPDDLRQTLLAEGAVIDTPALPPPDHQPEPSPDDDGR